jgi:hypothetical protein
MQERDPLLDPSLSEMEFAKLLRRRSEEEAENLRKELCGMDSDIKIKCDYLRDNPKVCTLEALQVLMDIITTGEYTFAGSEINNGDHVVAKCRKNGAREMEVNTALPNILWVVKIHYLLERERRKQEEIKEFISKFSVKQKEEPIVPVVSTENTKKVVEPEANDDLGRDPMRWLFFELRRRGYIKNEDDAFLLRILSELTGHSYKQIYKNKNEELTTLAKRRMIDFFEELIDKLNK